MKPEDYHRAVRATMDVKLDDLAAITIIRRADGGLYVSTVGETPEVVELLDQFADYLESVEEQLKGGKK